MRYSISIALLLGCTLWGCGRKQGTVAGSASAGAAPASSSPPITLNVFAAASLTESFTDIGKQFETANPGVTVAFNFAGSQQLRAQLESGAQADIFASANEKEMNTAKGELLVKPDSIHDFARNRLVVIFPKNNPAGIAVMKDLARPGIKIDVADVAVPVGKYTRQMLDQLSGNADYGPGFEKNVLANVVSREENVKSVLSKVRLGEADAGVVYVTDVTPDAAKDVGTLEVPAGFNQLAGYPIAVTEKSGQPMLARKFEDFILADKGQGILRQYNFIPIAADGH